MWWLVFACVSLVAWFGSFVRSLVVVRSLAHWFVGFVFVCLVHVVGSFRWLVLCLFVNSLVCSFVRLLFRLLVGCLCGLLVGWFVGSLVR